MDKPEREAERLFSQPVRQLTIMLVVSALVTVGAFIAWPRVSGIFLANPWLNGLIFLVFMIGVASCFLQVTQLFSSVTWIVDFTNNVPGHDDVGPPRLLVPLAALLRDRSSRVQITSTSATSILDSVATRIDEARDVTRYLVNLLIFLGLLGTFWGLATTVPAVVQTIRSLAPKAGQSGVEVFNNLMQGLQAQLGGMGTAFSSSLLGLAGSLVVGMLELFASHGQNRFYRQLEEWLSGITRLGFAGGEGEGVLDHGLVVTVLDQMGAQTEALQTLFAQSDIGRAQTEERLSALAGAVEGLTRRLTTESEERLELLRAAAIDRAAVDRLAEAQENLIVALRTSAADGGPHVDAESRMRLRSIDVQMLHILEEISAGRQESVTDLRGDIAALIAAIRQLSRGGPKAGRG